MCLNVFANIFRTRYTSLRAREIQNDTLRTTWIKIKASPSLPGTPRHYFIRIPRAVIVGLTVIVQDLAFSLQLQFAKRIPRYREGWAATASACRTHTNARLGMTLMLYISGIVHISTRRDSAAQFWTYHGTCSSPSIRISEYQIGGAKNLCAPLNLATVSSALFTTSFMKLHDFLVDFKVHGKGVEKQAAKLEIQIKGSFFT